MVVVHHQANLVDKFNYTVTASGKFASVVVAAFQHSNALLKHLFVPFHMHQATLSVKRENPKCRIAAAAKMCSPFSFSK